MARQQPAGLSITQADALAGGDVYDESDAAFDRYDQAEAAEFSSWSLDRYGRQSGQVAQVLDLREVLRLLAELMHCYPAPSPKRQRSYWLTRPERPTCEGTWTDEP